MGTCCSVPSVEEAESAQQFRKVDTNRDSLVDRQEMAAFVKSHAEMWAMLSVNLGLSEDICQETATRVAMELASGKEGNAAQQSPLSESQFHTFRAKYMVDGKGAQEFFHRCVFASFVKDGKQYLDANEELDVFLDTFYKSGSIFEGDTRLPPQEELKERITRNSSSGRLKFDEIRDIIRGTTNLPRVSGVSTTQHSIQSSEISPLESAPEETPEPRKKLDPPSAEFTIDQTAEFKNGQSAPEETPEVQAFAAFPPPSPKQTRESRNVHALPPPSPRKESVQQQETPEMQELPPPSPKPRPRQRKPIKDRAASTSRSPSQGRPGRSAGRSRSPSHRKLRRTTSRSGSPSQRKPLRRTASRSGSPSQRKQLRRPASRSGSPSQRKPLRRTVSRSRSPSQRRPRNTTSTSTANADGSPSQTTKSRQPPSKQKSRRPSGDGSTHKRRSSTNQAQEAKDKKQ